MPKVLLIDTKPHIYSTLKRKFEQEGFDVYGQQEGTIPTPDLIVVGKAGEHTLYPLAADQSVPIILLSADANIKETLAKNPSISHLKMPFRPSQLINMARQVVAGIV